MILSIVIPAYNVKSYLQTCVQSVSKFPIDDKEIIIVDDGSTDGTFGDAVKWINKLPCLCRVIHQENGGVSKARNVGMSVAQGDWIWFVDSDDDIDSNVTIDEDKIKDSNFLVAGFVWDENGVKDIHGARSGEIPYNLWRCWFRKDIIDSISLNFTIGRKYAEDQEFILKYLIESDRKYHSLEKSFAIDYPVYHYTMRPGSAMTKKGTKKKQINDVASVLLNLVSVSIKHNVILKSWVLHEIKRMTKTLIITLKR